MSEQVEIIALFSPQERILFEATSPIVDFSMVQEIEQKLYSALSPYFPAAGLAAPQIGIAKSAFIFSYDRDPAHLEIVVNPMFTPIGEEKADGWEGCLSVIKTCWKLANIPRFTKIKAVYFNDKGERVEKILEDFAARVFQHEWDHLQGILNITHSEARVKEFETKEAMQAFLAEVKKADAARYKPPN